MAERKELILERLSNTVGRSMDSFNNPSTSYSTRDNQMGVGAKKKKRLQGGAGGVGAAMGNASGFGNTSLGGGESNAFLQNSVAPAPTAPTSIASPTVASPPPAPVSAVREGGYGYTGRKGSFEELTAGRPESVVGGGALRGGTLRDASGQQIMANTIAMQDAQGGERSIPRGATNASGERIERGGGTFSTVSTPQSALDYNARVAGEARRDQANKIADVRAAEQASNAQYQSDKIAEQEKKAQDSALFSLGVGRYRKNAKQDKAFMADLMKVNSRGAETRQQELGGNYRAQLAGGAARAGSSNAAIQGIISQQKEAMNQANKDRRFSFDLAKEEADQQHKNRTFNQGERKLGMQGSEAEVKERGREAQRSISAINAQVGAQRLDETIGSNMKSLAESSMLTPDKQSALGFRQWGERWIDYDPGFKVFKKKLMGSDKDFVEPSSPEEKIRLFNLYTAQNGNI